MKQFHLKSLCLFIASVALVLASIKYELGQPKPSLGPKPFWLAVTAHGGILLVGPFMALFRRREVGFRGLYSGEILWACQGLSTLVMLGATRPGPRVTGPIVSILLVFAGYSRVMPFGTLFLVSRWQSWYDNAPWQHWIGLVVGVYHTLAMGAIVIVSFGYL